MAELYGKEYSKKELLKRVGDISQIGGVRLAELTDGNQKGARVADFRTGAGFNFTVSLDRGMDISYAEYQGKPLCLRTATGDVAPSFYEPEGLGWLRGFYGGLVTTCGLTYMGMPCKDEGRDLGLHGRASYTPAKNIFVDGGWEKDEYLMWARGKVVEASVFGENICLEREITAKLGESRFFIHDEVENRGFQSTPLMLLYHVNVGFPVVDAGTKLVSPTRKAEPRDDEARDRAEEYNIMYPPAPNFKEKVYFHEMAQDREGFISAGLINHKLNFGVYIKYPKRQFPYFIEWKMNGEGLYVCGIEPANALVLGRDKEREAGRLQFIKPGEVKKFHLEIGVLSSKKEIAAFENKVKSALK
ncbi:MAG: aldose 1-epimerase family protein [Candidatus Omnitrophica bacterium]|nr:aldose 1-epimerase family protein [Candidatus Omnitrophota bacterium]